jgi:hypothetical protein
MIQPLFLLLNAMFEGIKKIADEIKSGLEAEKWKAIDNNLSTMADANVSRIERGVNADGNRIGLLKSEPYARYKKATGGIAPFGDVDLKFSGDFLSGAFARRNNQTIVFGSTDEKSSMLQDKYGQNIFGLLEEQRTDIANGYIIPEIWDWVKTKLIRL